MKNIYLAIMIIICGFQLNSQNLTVEGKARITVMDTTSTADSIVVRLADGTLAIRHRATLTEYQVLSVSNDTIYLTDGGFVKLPADLNAGWNMNDSITYTRKMVSIGDTITPHAFEVFIDSAYYVVVMDQSALADGDSLIIDADTVGAQSFTAGRTDKLQQIDIKAKKTSRVSNASLVLELKTGNQPIGGIPLAKDTLVVTSESYAVYSMILDPPVDITLGDPLVLIVTKLSGSDAWWSISTSDVYPGGTAYKNTGFLWVPMSGQDFWFKTFVKVELAEGIPALTVTKERKIGIRESNPVEALEVKGALKIGANEAPTPEAGTIRWNASSQDFEGYNGLIWKSLTKITEEKVWGSIPSNIETYKVIAADGATDDTFGRNVSISGDYAIVGALGDDDQGSSSGSAYIFNRSSTNWSQQKKLTASDGKADDQFGYSVSISGNYAIVGAAYDDTLGNNSGSAYIFLKDQGGINNWGEVKKITASDGTTADVFGYSVSISGNYAIVGTWGTAEGAYIFHKDNGGINNWGEVTKITASDGTTGDVFGYSVSISGNYAIVAAPGDGDMGAGSGSAYVYHKDHGGINSWGEVKKLTASDGAAADDFGRSVSISGDYAIVGASGDDDMGNGSGSAYIIYKDHEGVNNWGEIKKLTASDGAAAHQYGFSVSISGDYAIIGAYNDSDKGINSGSAYIFNRSGLNWTQQSKLTASDGAASDYLGWSVSISGVYAIVGAYGDDDKGSVSGSAYIY